MRYLATLGTLVLLMSGAIAEAQVSSAGQAFVGRFNLKFENQSSANIEHLYISPAGNSDWGRDQLGEELTDVVLPGDSITIAAISKGSYDIEFVMSGGDSCVLRSVNVERDTAWVIDSDFIGAC